MSGNQMTLVSGNVVNVSPGATSFKFDDGQTRAVPNEEIWRRPAKLGKALLEISDAWLAQNGLCHI